jgi:hypothetical protein
VADTFGFEDLEEAINDMINNFDEKVSNKLGQIADEVVADTQLATPVDTGNLRRSWTRSDVEKSGTTYKVEVGTNIDYAEPVEFGHRVGTSGFVRGQFMLTKAVEKKKSNINKDLEDLARELMS